VRLARSNAAQSEGATRPSAPKSVGRQRGPAEHPRRQDLRDAQPLFARPDRRAGQSRHHRRQGRQEVIRQVRGESHGQSQFAPGGRHFARAPMIRGARARLPILVLAAPSAAFAQSRAMTWGSHPQPHPARRLPIIRVSLNSPAPGPLMLKSPSPRVSPPIGGALRCATW